LRRLKKAVKLITKVAAVLAVRTIARDVPPTYEEALQSTILNLNLHLQRLELPGTENEAIDIDISDHEDH
jgi:hypothetical protein